MLPKLTSEELQAARRAAAGRFEAIAAAAVPDGFTVKYRKRLSGMCYTAQKRIEAPRPVTRKSLYIFLHECAHAHLHVGSKKPRHVQEMEAEKWAHERMRANGVPVPRSMTKGAKEYVARKIDQAQRRGAKNIDPAARAYAKGAR